MKWGKLRLGIFGLILSGLVIASFIIAESKDEFGMEANVQSKDRNILYVGGSGANNYTNIQSAIDNASDGDTVFVYNGTYYENVVIDKSITFVGENKETTIIDGDYLGDVVNISRNNISMKGFSIINGGNWHIGIKICYVSNVMIYNCSISNNDDGIVLEYSSDNNICNCSISNNDDGIVLEYSSDNNICNCSISKSYDGILLWNSCNNSIRHCNISKNTYGIFLGDSCNNNISSCNFTKDGIYIESNIAGTILPHFIHDIFNNTVNGRQLLYYKNENNIVLDGVEAGQIILANCSNFEIRNENIGNTDVGIEIAYSHDIEVSCCNISNNNMGIALWDSYNNSLSQCNISNNNLGGIGLVYSDLNTIYMNNFMHNSGNICSYGSDNIWNSPELIAYIYIMEQIIQIILEIITMIIMV
ncbi:MAG TPA: hypothetical protein ENI53_00425 [Thermoplasmatales archaeon]|nr:hypothetical protein [Thermoplasmatales archaeon]